MTIPDIALYSFFLIIIAWGSKRAPFLPILCLILGITWGFLGNRAPVEIVRTVAKVALIFFLFLDSARLHFPKVLRYQSIRLPTIGLLATLCLGIFLTKFFFPLSWMESFMVVLPLLAIDSKVSPSPFTSTVPSRISQMFNVEASFTGIFAFLLLSIVHLNHPFHFFIGIFFPIIAGVGLGYICGIVGKTALECGWATHSFFRGSLFLIPFAIFSFCDLFGSNGFIGVISAGLMFGHTARALCDTFFDLARRQGLVLFYFLIILFGVHILHTLSLAMTIKMILFALLFLIVIRFLAVLASLVHSQFKWKTAFFFTFFAPKGLIPIATVFLFAEFFSFPNESLIINIGCVTIFLSLVIHSLFAYPVAHTYAHSIGKYPDAHEHLPTINLPT